MRDPGTGSRRLAVLGSPIAHSKSPALQRAAYQALGLDWEYTAVDVPSGTLETFVAGLDEDWRGLSLTMPLKREVLALLEGRSETVDLVGAANTVLIEGGTLRGFNTDVAGVIGALADAGVTALDSVHLLGAGATASAVVAAVAELGATRIVVSARTPENAAPLESLAATLGIDLVVRRWGVLDRSLIIPTAVICTLPGGSAIDLPFPEAVRHESVLLDVAYEPWPSALAQSWLDAGGTVVSGLSMLLHQAIGQVRIFVTGEEGGALDDETGVVRAMRASVGLHPVGLKD